jgi:hypothetical protein
MPAKPVTNQILAFIDNCRAGRVATAARGQGDHQGLLAVGRTFHNAARLASNTYTYYYFQLR